MRYNLKLLWGYKTCVKYHQISENSKMIYNFHTNLKMSKSEISGRRSLHIEYQKLSAEDLDTKDLSLLTRAREAVQSAYAPYSRFAVSAAVLLENEQIILGTNQENASYSLCLCAERSALASAAAQYPDQKIKAIAITAYSSLRPIDHPITPCGACRQVLREYEQRHQHPIRVIMQGASGPVLIFADAASLLPLSFTRNDLPE